jgi:hypothetical protein
MATPSQESGGHPQGNPLKQSHSALAAPLLLKERAMSPRSISFLLALLWLLAPARSWAEEQSFVDWFMGSLAAQTDTTAFRREEKAIVPARHAEAFLRRLEQLGGPLQARDPAPAGRVNMTSTDYLNTGEVLPGLLGLGAIPSGSISPKIRIRKYLTRDKHGAIEASPITDGFSALELKMPHPTRAGVSLKPRLLVNDRHLRLLLDGRRFSEAATREAVVTALKADTRNDPHTVDRFVQLFGQLHGRSKRNKLKPWINTRYQRTAYLIPLEGGGNIQVTVDARVKYRDPRSGKVVGKLKRRWRAVELKIPDAYAAMSDRQLQERGLGLVAQVRQLKRELLDAHQVDRFAPGRGKCNAFSRIEPKRADRLRSAGGWRAPR